ncbi:NfeD family protein [Porifericola rhodea]|uniref:NfeD family protein n=1 Tax=Porifericola rhodea TaxID=930972 RepID=UPI002665936F|nr:NfeD family protein [Porifericola rhodea]WKN32798.1 NfeD family protein [Porifericola rhodea]
MMLTCTVARAQSDTTQTKPQVLVMELRSEIDARTNRYVELAFERADEIRADLIVIDMDTYGGALYDADDIRTRILESEVPVYVYINKDAASAGALISIACDSIYMSAGASIGAATVVSGGTGEAAPDKYQSYMRSIMRATAEARGRDPQIAEAMVDQNLEVDSISKAGEVITFSTSEAIKYGFCEAQVSSIAGLLERSDLQEGDYTLTVYERDFTENIIAFFLNPFISGILILIMLGGVYFELQTPGIGFPIMAAIVALVLYLVPHYLNGLAENWEIAAFFVGAVLIALEVLVIPGFGVAGIAGLALTIGSLILVMLNNTNFDFFFVDPSELLSAVATALAGMFGGIILMFFGGVRLTDSAAFKRVSLESTQSRSEGYTSNTREGTFIGKEGEAYTVLRPSGKILIGDELFDAYTRGDYIPRGEKIVVVNDEGTSLRVKLAKDVPKEGLS